jgi:endonuclease/exonuclease/phosphatase family metal-dependent hydrolase
MKRFPRKPVRRWVPLVFVGLASAACASPDVPPAGREVSPVVRVATFNVFELSREKLDRVDAEGRGTDGQLRAAAETLQRVRPDILLLNEIDFDEARTNAGLFVERYLRVSQSGQQSVEYPQIFFEPVNTGVLSSHDLDRSGSVTLPEDGWGFGAYPGQYGMALLSRFPIDAAGARTFRLLRWRDMPANLMPDGTGGKPAWYPPEVAADLRLSSKSHWDVSVRIGGRRLHVLASHPTPAVFDGDEDRNGRRMFDEVRLWADYLTGGAAAAWIVDDAGRRGGLEAGADFVVMGDFNADPWRDDARYGRTAISLLLEHPRVVDPRPAGEGGKQTTREYGGPRERQTSDWGRLDYVLPSATLDVAASGVFWPPPGDPLDRLVEGAMRASDHRLVWVDLRIEGPIR